MNTRNTSTYSEDSNIFRTVRFLCELPSNISKFSFKRNCSMKNSTIVDIMLRNKKSFCPNGDKRNYYENNSVGDDCYILCNIAHLVRLMKDISTNLHLFTEKCWKKLRIFQLNDFYTISFTFFY